MKKLLFIAIFINLGLAGFWALLGSIENTLFASLCSVLCYLGFVIRDNGETK
jgi:hypothetical protein